MNNSVEVLLSIFSASGDEIFVCDNSGEIEYKNDIAAQKYPEIYNINKLSHLFDFEICILKNEDIMTYTPLYAAMNSKEIFVSNLLKQLKNNVYADYSICAIPAANNKKIIILRNNTNILLSDSYEELEDKIKKLEEEIANAQDLKHRLENQLIRTNLINLVSEKVREYISTEKILKITLEQLKKILNISGAKFLHDNVSHRTEIFSETDEDKKVSKLFVPVYQGKTIFGTLILESKNIQQVWQKDELGLLKNISSLLSTSFSKEELYKKIENQKKELEDALEQLKNAQLQIVQSEKMAALGQLVAGVAHEINTPLGAIFSNINMMEKFLQKNNSIDDVKEFINEITPINKDALTRIDNMVKKLKNFTRLDEAKKKKVDIIEGLKSTLALINYETKNRIKIIENYEKLPLISCYPDYINQVFMNIILNACQSIKKDGTIAISAHTDNKNIIVSIADTGEGIEKKNLKKIFDFGFTTKKQGKGTGLGLALVKKIVEEHNGKIEVESHVNKGTTFTVTLPVD